MHNQAAVELQQEGLPGMLCLAAIAGHQEEMVALDRGVDRAMGIDDCTVACTKKALEHAGVPMTEHMVATNLSLKKESSNGILNSAAVTRVKNAVKGRLESVAGGQY